VFELGGGGVAILQPTAAPLVPRLEDQVDAIARLGQQAASKGAAPRGGNH
jgi:hypothetical protein